MKRLVIAIAVIALVAACKKKEEGAAGGGAKPAEPPPAAGDLPEGVTPEMAALAEKMVSAMEGMGKDLTAAGTDCAKGAAAIRGGMAKLQPLVADAKKYEDKMKAPAAEKWFQDKYMGRMMGAMGGLMSIGQTCGEDADFQAAMKEMEALDM